MGQARYACRLLRENRGYFNRVLPKVAERIRVTPALVEDATLCAYNAGPKNVFACILTRGDPNPCTTGRDYGLWVMRKAAELRSLAPDLFTIASA
jgi:hypothetical protein